MDRCLHNGYEEQPLPLQGLRKELKRLVQALQEESSPSAQYMEDSLGNTRQGYSVYSGTGGNAYFYLELYRKLSSNYESQLRDALDANLQSCRTHEAPGKVSFAQGKVGVYAMAAVFFLQEEYLDLLLGEANSLDNSETEWLFGLAGYLYALLFVLQYWEHSPKRSELVEMVNVTVRKIIERSDYNGVLRIEWPRGRGKFYVGAAHGTIGVLYMLLSSLDYLTVNIDLYIHKTIEHLLSNRFSSGNFPSSEGKKTDRLVHFCHGATGGVLLLCKAHEICHREEYLATGIELGQVIWQRGLVLKGKGLCHGISGNAYAFLALYRATGEAQWLHKAHTFADLMLNCEELNRGILQQPDSQRRSPGTPDRPFSLFEGQLGTLLFYVDLLEPEGARFPCFELN